MAMEPQVHIQGNCNFHARRTTASCKNKARWKKLHLHLLGLAFLRLLIMLVLLSQRVWSQDDWDGVIITQSDFQGLEAFKRDLDDPKGFLRSWNDSGSGACSGGWAGIKCAQGQVIVIQLPWKRLGGRITSKIGQLQALRKLSLHDNRIGGSIPSSLGLLPNLRGLQLFNNRLTGSIPPSLFLCPLLQTLDLSSNSLTGVIPFPPSLSLSLSLNSTKLLYWVNLSYNSLSGSIPSSLPRAPSLVFLALQYNNLSGSIPDTWGGGDENISHPLLQSLTLDHNLFSGRIPASLGRSTALSELSLSSNHINGTIPDELGGLTRLNKLDLSQNSINGGLPASLSNLSSLVVFNVESNQLDGPIPEQLVGSLHNLSLLNLRGNRFSGPIPASIGNISALSLLDLSYNNFSGGIPGSLDNLLPKLSFLNVSYNDLRGAVPAGLSRRFNSSSFMGNVQLCGGYNGSTTPCPPSPPPPIEVGPKQQPQVHKKRMLSAKDIILIVAGILLIILLTVCCILLFCLIRKRSEKEEDTAGAGGAVRKAEKGGSQPTGPEVAESGGEAGGKLVHFDGPMIFTADDLLCATAEIMGKSTYGTVYKATLEDGNQVAVKRLREKITKGQKEFESEVISLGKIRHPNLLALRAYYLGPKGEKLLVFDYMPKGSLATFLHARGPDTQIDWLTRMKIIKGATRGLVHLHSQENIIHGNLTSSNVLMDEKTDPRIADYGLSKLTSPTANTSSVIATAGALGYRAPELSKLKKANTKTDIYSLGVIILELLTGKSPGEPINGVDLPQWVASIVKEEWTNEVFDLELMKEASVIGDELLNTLKLALNCVDPSPSARPEAQQLLHQLEEIRPAPDTAASATSGDEAAPPAPLPAPAPAPTDDLTE
ncbi:Probable leucine-rich repeat receptor-like protein kinase imk3 [Dionaea muscipula]